jgi:transcriptional regulator with XRE-family HTH domain
MDAADNLSRNLRRLREARGLTQAQMAKLTQLPRPTYSVLESGTGNPTLNVLVRLSNALTLSLEELLSAPREACRLYKANELIVRQRGDVRLRQLLPEALPGLSIERMELPPKARMTGVPHRAGTREYLACETGSVQLHVAEQRFTLGAGDVLVFRGDQKHFYENRTAKIAIAYSSVVFSPG